MKSRALPVVAIVLSVVIMTIIAGAIIYNGSDVAKIRKQLDLGQKYLSEMNYEEAVVAFNQAITIDPRSADAYLGLADAYLGMGDMEAALEALKTGAEATGDERLKERLDEVLRRIEEERAAKEAKGEAEEDADVEETVVMTVTLEEIKEIEDLILGIGECDGGKGNTLYGYLLTYDQRESALRPLVQKVENWLEYHRDDAWAWNLLSKIYCSLGEMDRCLEVRREGYEITGDVWLIPETYELPYEYVYVRDEYGRVTDSYDRKTIYGEGDRWISYEWGEEPRYFWQVEYDDLGRAIKFTDTSSDGRTYSWIQEYESDYSVRKYWSDVEGGYTKITYDEYGRVLTDEWIEPE